MVLYRDINCDLKIKIDGSPELIRLKNQDFAENEYIKLSDRRLKS